LRTSVRRRKKVSASTARGLGVVVDLDLAQVESEARLEERLAPLRQRATAPPERLDARRHLGGDRRRRAGLRLGLEPFVFIEAAAGVASLDRAASSGTVEV
jgi:hypothetical protein